MIQPGGMPAAADQEAVAPETAEIVAGSTLTLGVCADDPRPMRADAIEAWVQQAAPGDELHYCSGAIPRGTPGPRLVRALYDLGLVELFGRRIAGVWHYVARRIVAASDGSAVRIGGAVPPAKAEAVVLLAALRDCADDGLPCPSNRRLALMIGVRDGDRVHYLLRLLRRWASIRIDAVPEEPKRRVTILATGRATGVKAGGLGANGLRDTMTGAAG